MREILFRGQSIDLRKWYEGDLYQSRLKSVFYINYYTEHGDRMAVEVDPETVGQYTGMTDINGNKIFEGDICQHRSEYSGNIVISVVTYTDGQFLAMPDDNSGFNLSDKLEIIGNIHDNPELLGGKADADKT